MSNTKNTNIEIVQKHLSHSIEVMNKFPKNYVPNDREFKELSDGPVGGSFIDLIRNDRVQAKMNKIKAGWPADFYRVFMDCGVLIGKILTMYGVKIQNSQMDFLEMMKASILDLTINTI